MPYFATYVFNAGVIRFQGKYFISPRVIQYNFDTPDGRVECLGNFTGLGTSTDGIHFDIMPEPVRVHYHGEILPDVNDSRLSVIDGELYLSFCFENQHSERPGIARYRNDGSTDFDAVCIGIPQQRNMMISPAKVNGLYMRLERPSNQWRDPFHIWYSLSPDMRYWGDSELLLGCEDVPFASAKIGAGAPPLKTDKGYLLIFHAVEEDESLRVKVIGDRTWPKRYTAGAALFDLDDPTKLIAITKEPLLVAEAPYETGDPTLWVENTIFPCGAVLEDDQQTLRIYYGAGDANTNLATTTLDELWSVMTPCSRIAERATVPFNLTKWKNFKKYNP